MKDEKFAFPGQWQHSDFRGMELRDYFAAKALGGLITANLALDLGCDPKELAHDAYLNADAMMKARKQEKT